jgi:hypothetical protein
MESITSIGVDELQELRERLAYAEATAGVLRGQLLSRDLNFELEITQAKLTAIRHEHADALQEGNRIQLELITELGKLRHVLHQVQRLTLRGLEGPTPPWDDMSAWQKGYARAMVTVRDLVELVGKEVGETVGQSDGGTVGQSDGGTVEQQNEQVRRDSAAPERKP